MITAAAADPAFDVDKMNSLLATHERLAAKEAEMQFGEAMCRCQEELPPIGSNAKNPDTRSNYADLGQINAAIVPVYTENGFSLSFSNGEAKEGSVRVTCKVRHIGGHSEDHALDVPLDATGKQGTRNKTDTHAFGSSNSYGQRYLTKLIFNLTLVGDDDDGNAAGGKGWRGVVKHDIDRIKHLWWKSLGNPNDKNEQEAKDMFSEWMASVTEREFDVHNRQEWKTEDILKCNASLERKES